MPRRSGGRSTSLKCPCARAASTPPWEQHPKAPCNTPPKPWVLRLRLCRHHPPEHLTVFARGIAERSEGGDEETDTTDDGNPKPIKVTSRKTRKRSQ